uniref:Uncharacterized protein n=1 Tax=Mustela putorius furo TaxID=9669 RepID=M3Y5B0_MUSPF
MRIWVYRKTLLGGHNLSNWNRGSRNCSHTNATRGDDTGDRRLFPGNPPSPAESGATSRLGSSSPPGGLGRVLVAAPGWARWGRGQARGEGEAPVGHQRASDGE